MMKAIKMALIIPMTLLFLSGVHAGTFLDDFSDLNDFWVVGMGEWNIENGVYHQTDTTSNGARGLFSYVQGSETWGDDFTIETDVVIHTSGIESHLEAGIMYKWENKDNQFHVVLDQNNSLVRINNCVAGTWQANQNINIVFNLGEWHHIKVAVESNEHEIYIDGDMIQEYEREVGDKTGFIGLKTLGCEASFDNYSITGPGVPDFDVTSPVEYAGKLTVAWGSVKEL
jgi:hypothetical protein